MSRHYGGIVPAPRCPRCQTDQLDEDWGNHNDDCPDEPHRHLICTTPDCLLAFTVPSRPGKVS